MRKDIILPGLALVGGAAGFVLRRWQLASAWRPEAELFTHGAPATLALLGVLGAVLLALLALTLGERRRPENFLAAFACPQEGQLTVLAAAGLLMAIAGLLGLGDAFGQWQNRALEAAAEPMSTGSLPWRRWVVNSQASPDRAGRGASRDMVSLSSFR